MLINFMLIKKRVYLPSPYGSLKPIDIWKPLSTLFLPKRLPNPSCRVPKSNCFFNQIKLSIKTMKLDTKRYVLEQESIGFFIQKYIENQERTFFVKFDTSQLYKTKHQHTMESRNKSRFNQFKTGPRFAFNPSKYLLSP